MITMGYTLEMAARNKGMQVKDATADLANRSYNTIASFLVDPVMCCYRMHMI
jgi:hypothetical protein